MAKNLEVNNMSMFGNNNNYGNDKGNDAPIQEGGEYDVKIDDTGRDETELHV